MAIIDWYPRRVLSWRISNTTDTAVCVDCLRQALSGYGKPEIFNSGQSSRRARQFFTGVRQSPGIAISMDGRGRALDEYLRGAAVAQCRL